MPPDGMPSAEQVLTLDDLAGRQVVAWGAGVETAALIGALVGHPPTELLVVDDGLSPDRAAAWSAGAAAGVPVLSGTTGQAALHAAEVVVKSPGISRHLPLVDELRREGVVVTGSTALWLAGNQGRGVVGITGSKGKSTTTVLLAHLLRAVGVDVRVGGNLGQPLLSLPPSTDGSWTVAELSSFQCSEVRHSPAVGILTALFPDHLDWHGTAASYYADKLNLFAYGEGPVALNAADPTVRAVEVPTPRWYADQRGIHPDGTDVVLVSGERLPTHGTALRGEHNLVNLCGALTAVAACGIELDAHHTQLTTAVADFAPLEHRLQTVSRAAGLEWVDDGLATNPDAARAALTAFADSPVTILLGGQDRGVDYDELAAALAARPQTRALTMPDNGPRIAAALKGAGAQVIECDDLPDAVRRAAELTPPGGVVLLSPAAPSFGHFRDYRHRGEAFRAAIERLPPAARAL